MALPVGLMVGAGLGALGGLFGGKPKPQKTTTRYGNQFTRDPASQEALEMARNRYMAQYRQQPTAIDRQLQEQYQQMARLLGSGLQQGTQGIDQFFNPYQNEVIGGVQGDFDRQRAFAMQQANDMATRAGAFGGSRGEVAKQLGLSEIDARRATVLAGLRQSGWQDALQALLGQRGMNLNTARGGMGLLDQQQQYGQQRQKDALQQLLQSVQLGGYSNRGSSTTIGPPPQRQGNIFTDMLGGAAIGGSMFPSMGSTNIMPWTIPQLQGPAQTQQYNPAYGPPQNLYPYDRSWGP